MFAQCLCQLLQHCYSRCCVLVVVVFCVAPVLVDPYDVPCVVSWLCCLLFPLLYVFGWLVVAVVAQVVVFFIVSSGIGLPLLLCPFVVCAGVLRIVCVCVGLVWLGLVWRGLAGFGLV